MKGKIQVKRYNATVYCSNPSRYLNRYFSIFLIVLSTKLYHICLRSPTHFDYLVPCRGAGYLSHHLLLILI